MKHAKNLIFYTTIILTTTFLLCSCDNNRVFENVAFYFNRENHNFCIDYNYDGKVDFTTTADKVYTIYNTRFYNAKGEKINNEFVISTKELFIYD